MLIEAICVFFGEYAKGGGAMIIEAIYAVCAVATLLIEAANYFESKKITVSPGKN